MSQVLIAQVAGGCRPKRTDRMCVVGPQTEQRKINDHSEGNGRKLDSEGWIQFAKKTGGV